MKNKYHDMSSEEVQKYAIKTLDCLFKKHQPSGEFDDYLNDAWIKHLKYKDKPDYSLSNSIKWSFFKSWLKHEQYSRLKSRAFHMLADLDYMDRLNSASCLNPTTEDYSFTVEDISGQVPIHGRISAEHFVGEYTRKNTIEVDMRNRVAYNKLKDSLKPAYQEILELWKIGLGSRDIAELFGCTRNNIWQKMQEIKIQAHELFGVPLPENLKKYYDKREKSLKRFNTRRNKSAVKQDG